MKQAHLPSHYIFCVLSVLALIIMVAFGIFLAVFFFLILFRFIETHSDSSEKFFSILLCALFLIGCCAAYVCLVISKWKKAVYFNGILCPVHQFGESCACRFCGTPLPAEDARHQWDGCKCIICGTTRYTGHDWDKTGCICKHCGATNHEWEKTTIWIDRSEDERCLEDEGRLSYYETVNRCKKCGLTVNIDDNN